jgi:Helicase associated domain
MATLSHFFREDVPADIKDFVIYLRFEARRQQRKLEMQIKRLRESLNQERETLKNLMDQLDEAGYSWNKTGKLVLKPGVVSVTAVPGKAPVESAEFETTLTTDKKKSKSLAITTPNATTTAVSPPVIITRTEEAPKKKRAPQGPSWTWETAIEGLKHFQTGNGHLRVPTRSHLGRWVMEIRANYKICQRNPQLLDEPAQGSTLLDHSRVKLL